MDFITKHKGVLDFANSTIQLDDKLHDLTPPPRRSTLVRSKEAQVIDAWTSADIPVCLSRPVETACMLVEPISSLSRVAPGLEIPLAVVSSQSTVCSVTNDTDTPMCIDARCVLAIARNVCLHDVTEMIDFIDHESANELHVTVDQAHGENDNDSDFNDIMPFHEPPSGDNSDNDNDDNPNFEIDNPKLTAHEIAELISFLV